MAHDGLWRRGGKTTAAVPSESEKSKDEPCHWKGGAIDDNKTENVKNGWSHWNRGLLYSSGPCWCNKCHHLSGCHIRHFVINWQSADKIKGKNCCCGYINFIFLPILYIHIYCVYLYAFVFISKSITSILSTCPFLLFYFHLYLNCICLISSNLYINFKLFWIVKSLPLFYLRSSLTKCIFKSIHMAVLESKTRPSANKEIILLLKHSNWERARCSACWHE